MNFTQDDLDNYMRRKELKMRLKPKGDIELGDMAKDTITGFSGVVVGIWDCLHQCRRLGFQSTKLTKKGLPYELQWFDELQCELIEPTKTEETAQAYGGPAPTPTRNADPQ